MNPEPFMRGTTMIGRMITQQENFICPMYSSNMVAYIMEPRCICRSVWR